MSSALDGGAVTARNEAGRERRRRRERLRLGRLEVEAAAGWIAEERRERGEGWRRRGDEVAVAIF